MSARAFEKIASGLQEAIRCAHTERKADMPENVTVDVVPVTRFAVRVYRSGEDANGFNVRSEEFCGEFHDESTAKRIRKLVADSLDQAAAALLNKAAE